MSKRDDVTVFVHSVDCYDVVRQIFCHGFTKYWPDCPWRLRFVTNTYDAPCGKAIKVGPDRNWTAMTSAALARVPSPVILSLIDDYWLLAPPDTKTLMEYAAHCVQGRADMVGLWVCGNEVKGAEDFPDDPRLFVFKYEEQYRTSMRAAFWRVDALRALLKDGETIHMFETAGSGRSRANEKIVCVKEMGCILYPSAVTPGWGGTCVLRGQWTNWAYRYVKEQGLSVDMSLHPRGW